MLGSFLIFLREGIEGSMICAILLTYLSAGGRRDLYRWVFAGAGAAIGISLVVGSGIYLTVKDGFINSRGQLVFETCSFGLAVLVLTYMTFWMKRNARGIPGSLRSRVHSALAGGSGVALATVALVTVGREALETTVFLLAIAFQSSPLNLAVGALLGLTLSLGTSYAMYRMGMHLNLSRFFTVVGAALMVVAAGLLANMVHNLQRLGLLPGAGRPVWDTSFILPDDGRPGIPGTLGDVLHGLLGYAASPTALQVTTYLAFLVIGLYAFLRRPRAIAAAA
ncbi:MAG: FTR1 family iron permease [Candidatus Dormibacteria bacterium]